MNLENSGNRDVSVQGFRPRLSVAAMLSSSELQCWGASAGMRVPAFVFCFFLKLHLWHMEVPRLGAELELQLPATARATAMPDP